MRQPGLQQRRAISVGLGHEKDLGLTAGQESCEHFGHLCHRPENTCEDLHKKESHFPLIFFRWLVKHETCLFHVVSSTHPQRRHCRFNRSVSGDVMITI